MCFAAAGAVLPVLSMVGQGVGALMQYQGQKAQAAAQNAAYRDNQVAALAAQRDAEKGITLRQLQEAEAVSQQMHLSQVDQARRQASTIVSSIDAGRSGITVDALVDDIGRMADENRATLLTNWENTAAQLQAEKEGTEGLYQRRVNSVRQAVEPSPLTPLLGLAGAGLKYFTDTTKADTAAKV